MTATIENASYLAAINGQLTRESARALDLLMQERMVIDYAYTEKYEQEMLAFEAMVAAIQIDEDVMRISRKREGGKVGDHLAMSDSKRVMRKEIRSWRQNRQHFDGKELKYSTGRWPVRQCWKEARKQQAKRQASFDSVRRIVDIDIDTED